MSSQSATSAPHPPVENLGPTAREVYEAIDEADGEIRADEITEQLRASRDATRHALRTLRDRGYVVARHGAEGWMYHRLAGEEPDPDGVPERVPSAVAALDVLEDGPATTLEIAAETDYSQSTVYRRVRKLYDEGVLERERAVDDPNAHRYRLIEDGDGDANGGGGS